MHANVLAPSTVIAHDPQMPSRHDRRNVSVGSISFLILMRASRTIGPQSFRSMSYDCMWGLSPGWSGFCQRHKHPQCQQNIRELQGHNSAAQSRSSCSNVLFTHPLPVLLQWPPNESTTKYIHCYGPWHQCVPVCRPCQNYLTKFFVVITANETDSTTSFWLTV